MELLSVIKNCRAIFSNSAEVTENSLFLAFAKNPGDRIEHIKEAIKKAASCIVYENSDLENFQFSEGLQKINFIPYPGLKNAAGLIAAEFLNYPAKTFQVFGVTGTNGKTSVAYILAQALEKLGTHCAYMGTIGQGFVDQLTQQNLTTPDAVEIQKNLANFREQKAQALAMEVSSHALDQNRVAGIPFHCAIFTNLTQDHLDYHLTMQNYAAAKRKLFDFPIKSAILNADDALAGQWYPGINKDIISFSTKKNRLGDAKFIITENWQQSSEGIEAGIISSWGRTNLKIPLIGEFNLSNTLAVLAALLSQDYSLNIATHALKSIDAPPGRMEKLGGGDKPLVFVDFSHTPDALEKALNLLKPITKNQLICVFGCGGDRDRGKRPKMAAIAEKLADKVIFTQDNPRHEDPKQIFADMQTGLKNPSKIEIISDRALAIKTAITQANKNDCILIAGKGHENYQIIGDKKFHFSDQEVVREIFLDK